MKYEKYKICLVIIEMILIFLFYIIPVYANNNEYSFVNVLEEAKKYPVQYGDPASIQNGINLYANVIEKFPSHPDIYKAKLGIFGILKSEGTKESLVQASKIIEEVIDNIDISNTDKQNILLQYVDFHIGNALGYSFQNLDKAENIIEQMRKIYENDTYSLLRLHVIDRFAKIQILRNQEIDALSTSLNILEESLNWSKLGFWADLYEEDRDLYTKYVNAMNRISSTICWAIERSDKYQEVSQLLRSKPIVLSYSEMVRGKWKKIELEYIVGNTQEFERIQEEIMQPTLEETDKHLSQPEKSVNDISLVSTPDSMQNNENESVKETSEPQTRPHKSKFYRNAGISIIGVILLISAFFWFHKR